jgi:hypothetical protein
LPKKNKIKLLADGQKYDVRSSPVLFLLTESWMPIDILLCVLFLSGLRARPMGRSSLSVYLAWRLRFASRPSINQSACMWSANAASRFVFASAAQAAASRASILSLSALARRAAI